ncbi:unnamed protein product [Paramecium sonneborni]|uniref:F-box domain-containing protein n=1 Tax=Paramecium sonneborni TaxID=65129 RepID=A0A8S1QQK1_9CILI|nr:unnamed protein product [Paramecium sonneborni]
MQQLIFDLKNIEAQSQIEKSKLKKIFLELDEIFNEKQDILSPKNTKSNLFQSIRSELFALILQFLDLRTCLRFRLVNRYANICAINFFHYKIKHLYDKSKNLENELNEIQHNYPQDIINQDQLISLQNAHDRLRQLDKAEIFEIRMNTNQHLIIQKVFSLVCILLNPNIKQYQENWSDCQKMLKDYYFLNKILQVEIDNISDSQLQLLQAIHNIEAQQVQNISRVCYSFYLYLYSIVQIRVSKYYIIINQKLHLEKQIKSTTNLIKKLQQISK